MRTTILSLAILLQLPLVAQYPGTVTFSTNADHQGFTWTCNDTGLVDHLRPELIAAISAVAIPEGTILVIHDGEDGDGRDMMHLEGPLRMNDLKTLPRLHGNGNWDNAISSFRIMPNQRFQPIRVPNVIAKH